MENLRTNIYIGNFNSLKNVFFLVFKYVRRRNFCCYNKEENGYKVMKILCENR